MEPITLRNILANQSKDVLYAWEIPLNECCCRKITNEKEELACYQVAEHLCLHI